MNREVLMRAKQWQRKSSTTQPSNEKKVRVLPIGLRSLVMRKSPDHLQYSGWNQLHFLSCAFHIPEAQDVAGVFLLRRWRWLPDWLKPSCCFDGGHESLPREPGGPCLRFDQ